MICANESALNIYMRTVGQEERRLTSIENRAADLLLSECSPSRTDLVRCALDSLSAAVADAIAIHVGHIEHKRCASEKAHHYQMIGRLIAGSIDNYCATASFKQAEDEINAAVCKRCFDTGCPKCDPAED